MKSLVTLKSAYFSTALCIYIYLVLRAMLVPPVHDECATYFLYIIRDEWMPLQSHMDANNHILNSFLSAQAFKVFGQGLLFLRLSSLLFFPVFVFYTWKVSGYIKTKTLQALFLVAVLLVHNLVEYFAYSRGYAMSMALMMACIYYVLAYTVNFSLKKLWPFYIFSALAIISNLTLINTALLMNGFLFLSFFMYRGKWGIKILFAFLGLLPVFLAAYLSFEMKKTGLLYYGSNKGFWEVTVNSMSELLYGEKQVFTGILLALFSGMGCLFMLMAGKGTGVRNLLVSPRFLFLFLFIGNISATLLLQKLLHVNYPEDRTAMYFYFLLAGFFFFSLDAVPIKKIKHVMGYVWLVVPLHFIFSLNLTHSAYWHYEHIPFSFYTEIKKRAGDHPERVSVGGYNLMDLIWSYYNQQEGGTMNDMQTNDYPSFYYDFLLLYEDHNYRQALNDYNDLAEDPYSHIHLLERKHRPVLQEVMAYTVPDFIQQKEEYSTLYEADSLKYLHNLGFEVRADIAHPNKFLFGMFVLSAWVDGKDIYHDKQELHYFKEDWRKTSHFNHSLFIHDLPPNTDRITVYFWNPRKVPVDLTGIQMHIYTWK